MSAKFNHKNQFSKVYNNILKKSNLKPIITMETNQLKYLLQEEANRYFETKRKRFEVDEFNTKALNLICKYFSNDITFEKTHKGDLTKGLFLYGKNGIGKTSLFKIIQIISRKHKLKQLWYPIISTSEVVHKFNTDKFKDYIIKKYSNGIYMFDDLGAENEANNTYVFGKEDIFIKILEARYDAFISKGTITHITSNLSMSQISDRYGKRVEDRFYEMFNFIEIKGESRR